MDIFAVALPALAEAFSLIPDAERDRLSRFGRLAGPVGRRLSGPWRNRRPQPGFTLYLRYGFRVGPFR